MSGVVVALLCALLWAFGSVLLAISAKQLPVLHLNLVRCTVSTCFFWILLPFYGGVKALATIPPVAWLWLVVSVLGLLVVGDTLYFRSLHMAGVSWAMPVASINPLWAVVLAALFVDEPLTWTLLGGTLLTVAGIILVSRSTDGAAAQVPNHRPGRRAGLMLALGASALWAVGQVALKPGTAGMNAVVANSARQPMALLILLGASLFRGNWQGIRTLDRKAWGIIVVASLVGSGISALLFVTAIQLAGAGRSAVLTSTAPMMALPLSMVLLRERPTRWTIVGTLLTVAGIGLVA